MSKDPEYRLTKAKAQLIIREPFVGTLVLMLKHWVNPELTNPYGMPPTAQTDGKTVEYHPDFIATLSDPELLFVVAHETFHPMFDHSTRRRGRDPLLWNIAADYVINYHLKAEGIGQMPASALYDAGLFLRNEGITERIYDELREEEQKKQKGGGKDRGNPLDNCADGGKDPAELSEIEQQWRANAATAAQTAKAMGKLSAGMSRLFNEMMNPKVPWREVLHRFMEKAKTDERTYARFNRRMFSQGYYLPSRTGETMGEIVFAIDCSGSVGEADLAQFGAEIVRVVEDCNPRKMHIVYFDSAVCGHEEYTENDPFVRLKPHGGGGTAFSPIFKYVNKQGIEPVALVVLTDLYCDDYGKPPEYPVLWVTYGADKAPWGEVVKM